MQARIKSLHLENFKGVKNATHQFDGKNAFVIGQNGAGKTTLFTGFMWLMADKDSDLKSNPNIRPLGVEECTPRVEVIFDIDGKEITAAKIQKCTVKKSKTGGADTVSLSNSYEVNSVEYGERDFKKKMQEYGFDFDLFLPLSHPDVFTSQKSADMRKVLFGMASEKSDYEIACDTKGVQNVALLLENYTAEEVKAMQNATLRKIREEYGKDGEILRAKIEGMEQSKTDIDVAELELHRNALNEQIADNKAKQEDVSKEFEEQQKASDGILELKFKLNGIQQKANEELEKKRRELRNEESDLCHRADRERSDIGYKKTQIHNCELHIKDLTVDLEKAREEYTAKEKMEFDENDLTCKMCGQPYPAEKAVEIRMDFHNRKNNILHEVAVRGNSIKEELQKEKDILKKSKKELETLEKGLSEKTERIEKVREKMRELPESIDISDRTEVQEIQKQIAEKEDAMNKSNSAEEIRQQLKDEENDLRNKVYAVDCKLVLSHKNVEIDEQIAALRKKQGEYEQNKANAEKILYQLDLVSRKKNELLTEDINKNFDIVKWHMFEYQKNGDYKDCCVPMIDGKRFGESTNTGREVLAKLDTIKGLQRFYGQYYPVFLDGAECLSDETVRRIEMDCQLILLKVTEDKELKIEMEG